MVDSAMLAASLSKRSDFKILPLAGLIPNLVPPVDLYVATESADQVRLYRSAELPITSNDIDKLRSRGVKELLVLPNDYEQIGSFLAANLGTLLHDESHPPGDRLRILNQVVSDTLRDAFESSDVAEAVVKTQDLATHVVEVGIRSDVAIRDVAQIASHDFCTFTHSSNVACFGTLLAHALGIRDTNELCQIAAGGMLHDLGKLDIPSQILCKPGRLTKEEMSIMRLHPTRGFQLLRREKALSREQLLMAYQHHEWMNGAGYPVGCVGQELHLWSRICAVVDVFEALTGKRPYRQPNSISDALAIMDRECGTHFDADILRCWKSNLVEVRA
jgi:HD-GYP domain-containing protein (c-di-GMP phosphodiesterase class II)